METLLQEIRDEQRKTNELLVMLIEALAEADGDMDAEPTRYMDGTPIHGYQPQGGDLGDPPRRR